MGGGKGDRREKVGSDKGNTCPLSCLNRLKASHCDQSAQCCCVVRGIALLSESASVAVRRISLFGLYSSGQQMWCEYELTIEGKQTRLHAFVRAGLSAAATAVGVQVVWGEASGELVAVAFIIVRVLPANVIFS